MEMDLYNTETMVFHTNTCYCFKWLDALDTSMRVKAMSNWLYFMYLCLRTTRLLKRNAKQHALLKCCYAQASVRKLCCLLID